MDYNTGGRVNFDGTTDNNANNLNNIIIDQKFSIVIGENAGQTILPSASTKDEFNILIGHNTAQFSKNIEHSIIIGENAGKYLNNGSENIIIGNDYNNEKSNIDNIISIGYSNIFNSDSIYNNILGTSNSILNFNSVVNIPISCNNIIGNNNTIEELNNSIIIGNYNNINNLSENNLICIGNDIKYNDKLSLNIDNSIIKNNNNSFTKNDIIYNYDNLFIGNDDNTKIGIGFNDYNLINNIIENETSNIYFNNLKLQNLSIDLTSNTFESSIILNITSNSDNKYIQSIRNNEIQTTFNIVKITPLYTNNELTPTYINETPYKYSYITDIIEEFYDQSSLFIEEIENQKILNNINHSLYVNNGINTDYLSINNNNNNKISLYSSDNLISNISYILPNNNINTFNTNNKYVLSISNYNELYWLLNTDIDDNNIKIDNISNYLNNIETKTSNFSSVNNGNLYLDSDLTINGILNINTLNITGSSSFVTRDEIDNISTMGPPGPRGLKGEKGEQGDKGDKGEKGDSGKGFKNAYYDNTSGIITFNSDDGLFFTTNDIRGEKGDGYTGGYYNVQSGRITFLGTKEELTFTTGSIIGPPGEKGDSIGEIIFYNYDKTIQLGKIGDSSISTIDILIPNGPRGIQGIQGLTGLQGEKGEQGIQGIEGAPGPIGPSGPQGLRGPPGTANVIAPVNAGDYITISYDNNGYPKINADINNISTQIQLDSSIGLDSIIHDNILEIEGKTSNIEIIDSGNIKLNSDLTIIGTLYTNDLNVSGNLTAITTNNYITENIEITSTFANGPSLKITHDDGNDNIVEIYNYSTNNVFTINSIGNVYIDTNLNIGTSTLYSPNTILHVKGTSHGYAEPLVKITQDGIWSGNHALHVDGYTNLDNIRISGEDTAATILKTNVGKMSIVTYDGDMIFDPNGNVGIGISNPSKKLDIAGDINLSGDLFIDGTKITFASDIFQINGTNAYYNNGNLGIGITTPNNKFDLRDGDLELSQTYYNDGKLSEIKWSSENVAGRYYISKIYSEESGNYSGDLIFSTQNKNGSINSANNVEPTEKMRIKDNGNVGIGISPNYKLDVNGDIKGEKFISKEALFASNQNKQYLVVSNTNSTNPREFSWNYKSYSNGVFRTSVDYKSTSTSTPVEYFTIKGGGNVGIGTTNPNYKLDIAGDINISAGSSFKINGVAIETTDTTYTAGSGISIDGTTINSLITQYEDSDVLTLLNTTGVTGGLKVTSGNVGIGTDNPTSILDIHGSQNWDGMTKLRLLNPASEYGRTHLQLVGRYENNNDIWSMSNGRNCIIFSTQTSKDATIVDTNTIQARNGNLGIFTSGYSTSSPALVLNSTGNVGIGTHNPSYTLDVNGDINISAGSSFKINGLAIATTDTTYTGGTGITISGTTINSDITQYQDSDVLTLLNTTGVTGGLKVISGNVGIGTHNPSYTLDVNGDINISAGSSFKINGLAIATTDTTYTGGTGISISGTTINSDITQYTDSNVVNLLSTNAINIGIGIAAHSSATLSINRWTRFEGTERISHFNYSAPEHTYIRGGKNTSYVLLNDNGGYVGVGTGTPQYTLDVSGNINFTGNLTKNGNTFTSYTDSDVLTLLNTTGVTGGLKVTSGNVGIGTTTPDSILDIIPLIANSFFKINNYGHILINNGNSNNRWTIANRDTGALSFATDTTTGGNGGLIPISNDTLTILTSGNVGIGTTTPGSKLDINGDINISSGSSFKINGLAIATTDTTYSAGTGITIDGTTINSEITQYTDSNVISLLNSGISGGLKVTSGNVGIGTTNPLTKLHLDNGAFYLTGNVSNPGNNYSASFWNQGGVGPTISGFCFSVQTNGTSESLKINSDGNVGIGTTSPEELLHIQGTGNPRIRISGTTDHNTAGVRFEESSGQGGEIIYDGNPNLIQINTVNGGTVNNAISITRDTRLVGIGTTSPQTKLHVYVDSDTDNNLVEVLRLERHCDDMSSSANAEGGYISLKVDDDNASFGEAARISWRADNSDNTEDSGRLGFWTSKDDSCTEKLTITKDGNTGIGISNPSKKLDVAGDINLSGWIYKNNLLLNTTTILKNNVSFDSTSYDSVLQHKRGHINYSPNWRGSTTRYCLIDLILRPTGYWGALWHWSHNPTRYSRIMLKETYNTYNSPATYDYSVQSVNNDLLGRTDYGLDLSFNGSELVFNIGPNDSGYIWNYIGYTLIELKS